MDPSARTLNLTSADGARIHASLFAAEEPVAGLVMVHGMQSHAGWFEAAGTANALAAAGITCLAYDRRGSGRSGGPPGHTARPDDMLADLDAARSGLRRELERAGAPGAPLSALANCFGTRIVLPYLDRQPDAFASLTLTAPATHMSSRADYGLGERLKILLARGERTFATPLSDEYALLRAADRRRRSQRPGPPGLRVRSRRDGPDVERSLYVFKVEFDGALSPSGEQGGETLPAEKRFDFLGRLDDALGELNIEYQAKRASGRLGPPVLQVMKSGWYERGKQSLVAEGKRLFQAKTVLLDAKSGYRPEPDELEAEVGLVKDRGRQ